MDPVAFRRTADIALRFGVIRRPASSEAYTHDIRGARKTDRIARPPAR
jgi:hypothetical protein